MRKSRRVRTVGAVIVNPRRRKVRAKSKARRVARNPRRLKMRRARKSLKLRRNPRRRVRVKARRRAARRNPRMRARRSARRSRRVARRNPRKGFHFKGSKGYSRRKTGVKAHDRRVYRRKARKNPRVLTSRGLRRVRNPRRGRRKAPRVRFMRNPRRRGARRNPAIMRGAQSFARKLPLVGGPLAGILGILPISAVSALAVELPLRGSQAILSMGWVPEFAKKQPVYLALSGAILGALAGKFAPKMKSELQLGITSAAFGAAYFSWRQMKLANDAGIPTPEQVAQAETGSDPQASVEGFGKLMMGGRPMGALSVGSQSFGMGPAYSVGPQGFGAVLIGS